MAEPASAGVPPSLPATASVSLSSPARASSVSIETFNASEIWSVEFQPGPGSYDFWIDDLGFY